MASGTCDCPVVNPTMCPSKYNYYLIAAHIHQVTYLQSRKNNVPSIRIAARARRTWVVVGAAARENVSRHDSMALDLAPTALATNTGTTKTVQVRSLLCYVYTNKIINNDCIIEQCRSHNSCDGCTADPNCSWCSGGAVPTFDNEPLRTSFCVYGKINDLTHHCLAWHNVTCPGTSEARFKMWQIKKYFNSLIIHLIDCQKFNSCDTCVQNQNTEVRSCGWCGSSSKCFEGNALGPFDEFDCTSNWTIACSSPPVPHTPVQPPIEPPVEPPVNPPTTPVSPPVNPPVKEPPLSPVSAPVSTPVSVPPLTPVAAPVASNGKSIRTKNSLRGF